MTRSHLRRNLVALALALAAAAPVVAWRCAHAEAPGGATVVHHARGEAFDLWVVEEDGLRYLRFERDGINQSAVKMGDPTYLEFAYTQAMVEAFALAPDAKRVLVIGLGGGTLPMFLRHYDERVHIDVVDIEAGVVEAAKRFLGFRPDKALAVHVADGRRFVEDAKGTWDLILLDAYGPDAIPLALATKEFLAAVKAHLAPGGLVAGNLWSERANRLYPSMLRTWEAVFGAVRVVRGTASASRITLAGPAVADLERDGAIAAAERLAARWKLGFDLAAIVREGYEGPKDVVQGGEVLTDADAKASETPPR
ncbi:MAG: fused MFS/spermidine synthase [Myxococcales bacterium]|nr:fused MFS/spermidine synthase [Myxococcales bacterium]MCB9732910.1 fused MFS/spermidine synthase [Deltaproteobacteria bacterium]